MKGLLALCLGWLALAVASRSPRQQRAVELALEDFHSRSQVRWVYKEQAVEEVTEEEDPAGYFVRLRLSLSQTQCPNQPGRRQDCAIKPKGRKQSCLVCVKFDFSSPAQVLDKRVHCRPEQSKAGKDVELKVEAACREMQEASYLPGHRSFTFSKELPS
ncbi:retinoic acid receptor responder protein 2-like [Pelodiscus sinensis]|uniref:retinoic acid receptor responder protein 2-like n=1 Tax=Pelodiscus sinensis TaxID=13735 RepID=UPI003F6C7C58